VARTQRVVATVDLDRSFHLAGEDVHALRGVSLNVLPGQFIAVVGRSGSGKTTLLNLLAGLDQPSSGQVLFEERDMAELGDRQLTELRRTRLGFVFQSFGLLPLLSAYENVELPLRIAGVGGRERNRRTEEVLEIVGLVNRSHHRPYELSGGEQQRVAIARAIVHEPVLILADEPTGELDSVNARAIFGLFKEMVQERGISVIAATHDSTLLAMADQVVRLADGRLEEQATYGQRFRD
jgi:putative ABC transport system ATP-binding protein